MNEWERLAGEGGVTFSSGAEQAELLRASVRGAGTHAALENTEAIAHLSLTAPEYRVGGCRVQGPGYQVLVYLQALPPLVFHISKEQIRSHYHGWILAKGSVWKEEIGMHILECAQVCINF